MSLQPGKIVGTAIDDATCEMLRSVFDRLASNGASAHAGAVFGIRNVLGRSPAVSSLARGVPLADLAVRALGPTARPVRAILFDKTTAANWPLPWHQDRTIAVAEKRDVPGFSKWTCKGGVWHVVPPVAILRALAALRVHLDDCDADNGALQIVPGPHSDLLNGEELAACRHANGRVVCTARTGEIVLLPALTPHASNRSRSGARRRILHIEYCAARLPDALSWAEPA